MHTTVKALLLAGLMMISGPAFANHAQVPAACKVTEALFYDSARNLNPKVRVATDHAREVILTAINKARTNAGMWELEADTFAIGLIRDKGRVLIGIVMFKDHCVVPGTVKVFEAQEFIAYIVQLGLSMDDFVETNGV